MTLPTPNSAMEKTLNSCSMTVEVPGMVMSKLETNSARATSPSKSSTKLEPRVYSRLMMVRLVLMNRSPFL